MNLLFDFITLQDTFVNGGAAYTLEVLNGIFESGKCVVYGLLSKKLLVPEFLQKIIREKNVTCFYIQDGIERIVEENGIDRFYIGISQRYNSFDLSRVSCRIIMTCHDVGDLCQLYDGNFYSQKRNGFVREHGKSSYSSQFLPRKLYRKLKSVYRKISPVNPYAAYDSFSNLIQSKNVFVFTVSEYSKYAILYFFENIANEIEYFYAPQKTAVRKENIENEKLKELADSKKKYFVLVSADRTNKNAALFAEQWEKFCKATDYEYYALVIGKISYEDKNIVQIDYLNSSDLENAYKNAYALVYPSVSEGFGYPPVEAMKYGTPVLCSNATSIPEVCGDGALYFNAYYPEDLFRAMIKISRNRAEYSKRAADRYKTVSARQKTDFRRIVDYILTR